MLKIIEYTYRNDTFFWINQDTLKGSNILGKLLMEYRDNNKYTSTLKKLTTNN